MNKSTYPKRIDVRHEDREFLHVVRVRLAQQKRGGDEDGDDAQMVRLHAGGDDYTASWCWLAAAGVLPPPTACVGCRVSIARKTRRHDALAMRTNLRAAGEANATQGRTGINR